MRQIKHPTMNQVSITDIMYALSDPGRIEMVRRLYAGSDLTCGELDLDRPKSSMSHHFKILRESGLIETKVQGKQHLNTLRKAEIEQKFPGLLESVIRAAAQG